MKSRIFMFSLLVVIAMTASSCRIFSPGSATSTTSETSVSNATSASTVVLDQALLGQWTTESSLIRVVVNEKGETTGEIPVGQWIEFQADGAYYRVARHITVAIGGIGVEEGRYEAVNGSVLLFERKTSFFPDQGSPQKPSYRQPEGNENLQYAISKTAAGRELTLKSGQDDMGIRFTYCPD